MDGLTATTPKVVRKNLYQRFFGRTIQRSRRRLVRYGLLAANVVLLLAVIGFVLGGSGSNQIVQQSAALGASNTAANPLDQVSSADIAVSVARMANLPQAVATANNADSLDNQLSVATTSAAVVDKPQIVATALKSRRDIISYVTQAGDTVTSVAAKFSVTSNTVRWSNSLTGDSLPAGKTLYVLPGVSGIIYTVKAGDTPASLAAKYATSQDQIIAYNDAEITGLQAGQQIIIPSGVLPTPQSSRSSYYGGFSFGSSALYGNNGYDYGFCTWYASNRRSQLGRPVPSNLGNAYSWYALAQMAGLPTGLSPQVGAVAVNTGGNHVAVVEAVNGDGSFWISEMNSRGQVSMSDPTPAGGWGRVDYKFFTSAGNLKFIY